jgi:gamma-glutamylputrescine oxidase|tara:strand:+ start:337 stop:1623 length:1287 start_codon:yes stop_codon:yes gene_type:complete
MKETSEHTNSYYAASKNWQTDYPKLEGDHHCDVAIVGGGFTGVSAALRLIEHGYKVAVVEANRISWGASGRNGGQLIDGFVMDLDKFEKKVGKIGAEIAYQMGIESRDVVLERIKKHSIDCDLKFGFLDVAMNQGDIDDFHEWLEEKQENNYPHKMEFITQENLKQHVGSDKYIAGVVNYGNGHLHPLNLCIGEARAIVDQGGAIFEQSLVKKIKHGENPKLITENGVVHAKKVILAGNAYLRKTEPKLAGAVIPAGSYIIATEPLSESLANELLPSDMAVCDQRVGLDYYRLSADRRMLFGGLCNYSGRNPKSIKGVLQPKMLNVFPQLAGKRIDYEWGGYIGISINRIPQMGRIQNNTYYVQGYSGHGLCPTHIAGNVIADAIVGDTERFDVFEKVKHIRLPGGLWFANPALALGMMWFRLKELLA